MVRQVISCSRGAGALLAVSKKVELQGLSGGSGFFLRYIQWHAFESWRSRHVLLGGCASYSIDCGRDPAFMTSVLKQSVVEDPLETVAIACMCSLWAS